MGKVKSQDVQNLISQFMDMFDEGLDALIMNDFKEFDEIWPKLQNLRDELEANRVKLDDFDKLIALLYVLREYTAGNEPIRTIGEILYEKFGHIQNLFDDYIFKIRKRYGLIPKI